MLCLLLVNCEKENISDLQLNTKEKGSNKFISNKNFSELTALQEFVKDVKTQENVLLNRTDLENSNGFTINQNANVYVYSDSLLTSYTIAINKDYSNFVGFSNLVVEFNNNKPTNAFILNYKPTQSYWNAYAQDNTTPFQGSVNYEPIDYDGTLDSLNQKSTLFCQTIRTNYCNYGGDTHPATENCTESYIWTETTSICMISGGFQWEPIDTSITTPAGPSSGGGYPNVTPTYPMPTEGCDKGDGDFGITNDNGDCVDLDCPQPNATVTAELNTILGAGNFSSNCDLNPDDVPEELHFETEEELENYIESLYSSREDGEFSLIVGSNNQNPVAHFEFYDLTFRFNIYVQQNLGTDYVNFSDYSVSSVTSDITGGTYLVDWNQTAYGNTTNGYYSITDIYGFATVVLVYKGMPVSPKFFQHFRVVTNATDGSKISQQWVD